MPEHAVPRGLDRQEQEGLSLARGHVNVAYETTILQEPVTRIAIREALAE